MGNTISLDWQLASSLSLALLDSQEPRSLGATDAWRSINIGRRLNCYLLLSLFVYRNGVIRTLIASTILVHAISFLGQ